ncbi:MAG: MGMT family protein [Gammaproteobacteria bacterium]
MSGRRDIYDVVMRIPRGRVASYGRIARMLGCGARQVGYAMAAAPPTIPWHRVINSKGEISARAGGGDGDERQRRKLLREGVVFNARGRVDFARFGWGAEECGE